MIIPIMSNFWSCPWWTTYFLRLHDALLVLVLIQIICWPILLAHERDQKWWLRDALLALSMIQKLCWPILLPKRHNTYHAMNTLCGSENTIMFLNMWLYIFLYVLAGLVLCFNASKTNILRLIQFVCLIF
jgi:hypothetical protein